MGALVVRRFRRNYFRIFRIGISRIAAPDRSGRAHGRFIFLGCPLKSSSTPEKFRPNLADSPTNLPPVVSFIFLFARMTIIILYPDTSRVYTEYHGSRQTEAIGRWTRNKYDIAGELQWRYTSALLNCDEI